jgi:hypothetical protein
MLLPRVSTVHHHHRRCCRWHRATTTPNATTVVELIVIHVQRERQQQHHHQRTNINVNTFTNSDDLDLFNLPTVPVPDAIRHACHQSLWWLWCAQTTSTKIGSKDMVAVTTAMETAAAGAATTAVGAPTTALGVGADGIAFATAWEG